MQENPRSDRDWEHWPGRKVGRRRHPAPAPRAVLRHGRRRARGTNRGEGARDRGAHRPAPGDDQRPRTARGPSSAATDCGRGDAPAGIGRARRAPRGADAAVARPRRARGEDSRRRAGHRRPQAGARSRRATPRGRGATRGGGIASARPNSTASRRISTSVSASSASARQSAPGRSCRSPAVPSSPSPFEGSVMLLGSPAGYRMIDRPTPSSRSGPRSRSTASTYVGRPRRPVAPRRRPSLLGLPRRRRVAPDRPDHEATSAALLRERHPEDGQQPSRAGGRAERLDAPCRLADEEASPPRSRRRRSDEAACRRSRPVPRRRPRRRSAREGPSSSGARAGRTPRRRRDHRRGTRSTSRSESRARAR